MFGTIKRFLTPPVFPDDEDKTRAARLLFALLVNMLAVLVLLLLGTIFLFIKKLSISLFIMVLLGQSLASCIIAKRGRVRLAGILFLATLWLAIAVMMLLSGTIYSIWIAAFVVITVMAGLLLGERSALLIAALSALAGLGLVIPESLGFRLYRYFPAPTIAGWLGLVLVLIWVITPLRLAIQGFSLALARARNSENRYAAFFNEAPMMYLIIRDDGGTPVISDCNAASQKILGYPRERLIGRPLAEFYTPQSKSELLNGGGFQRALHNEVKTLIERDLIAEDGHLIHTLLQVAPELDEAGRIIGVLAMYLDITEPKRAESALKKNEEQFRLLAENSTDMISRYDLEGNYLYVSPACRALLEYEPEEMVGRSCFEFIHPEDLPAVERSRAAIIEQAITAITVFRIQRKNGGYIWLETTSHAIADKTTGSAREIHAASRDVTERKRAEDALRASEDRYRRLVEGAPDVVYVLSTKRGGIYYSPHVEQALGYSAEQLYAQSQLWNESIHPEDRDRINGIIRDFAIQGYFDMEYRIRDKHGNWRWLRDRSIGRDFGIDEILIEGLATDITERKLAEMALKESEEQFRSTFEQAAVGIAHVSMDFQWLKVNKRLCDIVGYAHEELLTKTFKTITLPDELGSDLNSLHRLMTDEIRTFTREKRYIKKDGSLVWANLTVTLLRDPAGVPKYFVAIVEDISRRKQAEEELTKRMRELVSWHNAMLGREGRVMELKGEVNELLARLGQAPRYEYTSHNGADDHRS